MEDSFLAARRPRLAVPQRGAVPVPGACIVPASAAAENAGAAHGDGGCAGCVCSDAMDDMTPAEISLRIDALRREHRALDEQIQRTPANLDDELQAKRLKKRKLQLKDCIMRLENLLIPDEPA